MGGWPCEPPVKRGPPSPPCVRLGLSPLSRKGGNGKAAGAPPPRAAWAFALHPPHARRHDGHPERLALLQKSIAAYRRTIAIDSENVEAHYGLGIAYDESSDAAARENPGEPGMQILVHGAEVVASHVFADA